MSIYLHIEAPGKFDVLNPFQNASFKVTGNGDSLDAAFLMAAATQALANRDGAPTSELYDVIGSIIKFFEASSKSVTIDTNALKRAKEDT